MEKFQRKLRLQNIFSCPMISFQDCINCKFKDICQYPGKNFYQDQKPQRDLSNVKN